MSFVRTLLPIAVAAATLAAACTDATSPNGPASRPSAPHASKGTSGGGGGGGGGGTAPLVVTTPPTVNATGQWLGTSDGPDVVHTYTFTLSQATTGMASGSGTMSTATQNASYLVTGTVNGDTLMLYTGTTCGSCTLNPLYRGLVSADGSRVDGNFLNGGISPVTLYRQ